MLAFSALMTLLGRRAEYVWGGGVGASQVKPSNCFRRLEKLVYLPFLTQVFHLWWRETCRVIQQQFWMKECDILGGQNTLWPLHIFRGQDPQRPGSSPLVTGKGIWPANTDRLLTCWWRWSHWKKITYRCKLPVTTLYHLHRSKISGIGLPRSSWTMAVR